MSFDILKFIDLYLTCNSIMVLFHMLSRSIPSCFFCFSSPWFLEDETRLPVDSLLLLDIHVVLSCTNICLETWMGHQRDWHTGVIMLVCFCKSEITETSKENVSKERVEKQESM